MAEEIKKEEIQETPQEQVQGQPKPEIGKIKITKPKIDMAVKPKEKEEKPSVAKTLEGKPIKVPAKFKKLVEEIGKMSVLDLAELVKLLEKKFGVSAVAPVAVTADLVSAEAATGKEAKSKFNIELTAIGEKKIDVIKVVRDITQKGLKDSKDLVDAVASGAQVVKENVKKEEAEELKKKFEAAGATVELK